MPPPPPFLSSSSSAVLPPIQEVHSGGEGRKGGELDKIKLFARSSGCAEAAQANERVERRFSRLRIRCQAQFPSREPMTLPITGPTCVTNC